MLHHTSFILLLLLTIISLVKCGQKGGSSLTFVIDDSESMEDDINQVRKGARGIMDIVLKHKSSQIKDIVLVTFNDPLYLTLLRKKTRDPNELQASLNAIVAHNEGNKNNDWPEFSMSGVELALQESQPGSYLYVFTDAAAKDYKNADIVINLCQKTQSQIIFVLTDYCRSTDSKSTIIMCNVYHKVAHACSGQVFIVNKREITKVIEYVKETVKGEKNIITTRIIPPFQKTTIKFTIDDKTEYALISVSGDNVTISDMTGPSKTYEAILSTLNVKVLKLTDPIPGSYELKVYGDGKVSVIIFGRTDFVFDHGFSEMIPKSLQDTSKQPISGTKNHLSISVNDPDHEINIISAQILNMKEEIIYELPLRTTTNDFYITDQFVAPNSMFKVAVIGTVIKTKKSIRRISKTSVQPQKPKIKPIQKKDPVSLIKEGSKMNTNYDSTLQLTCKVTGYPAPTIIWKDDKGQVLPSKSTPVLLPYEYISYLSLSHMKKSGRYYCYGTNTLDNTHSSIDVTVLPAFTVDKKSIAPLSVNYDKEAVINCKIQTSLPRRIYWFRTLNNKDVEQITSSNIYTISSDGSVLKINNIKIALQGKYTCKATLVADENEYATFDTEVKINDLAKPQIRQSNPTQTVKEKTHVYIPCKIINGIPKPQITWTFQSKASGTFKTILNSGEQIEIVSSQLSDAGHYTCTAKNELGKVKQQTELIVEELIKKKAPVSLISNGSKMNTNYDSTLQLTCKVTGYPAPTIIWKDDKGQVLPSKSSPVLLPYEYISYLSLSHVKKSGRYYCYGTNTLDNTHSSIDVTVLPAFTVDRKSKAPLSVNYDKEAVINCKIQTSLPRRIYWFRTLNNKDVEQITSSNIYTISSDGSVLKINNIKIALQGKYTCKATLVADENEYATFDTEVKINDLAKPQIRQSNPTQTVKEKTHVYIPCKIINGIPKPQITWTFQSKASGTFKTILNSGEQIEIVSSQLSDAGHYTCTAKNELGKVQQQTELIVEELIKKKAPVSLISNGSKMNTNYDSTLQLTCKVTGYPAPTIIWKDDKGQVLPSKSSPVLLPYEYISYLSLSHMKKSGRYYCYGTNTLDNTHSSIDVTVLPAFTVDRTSKAPLSVNYDKEAVIHCKIQTSLPRRIYWFRTLNNRDFEHITSSNIYTISSDGSMLKIHYMKIDLQGKYTCKATLEADENENATFDTEVKINDLAKPQIKQSKPTLTVKEKTHVYIPCKIINGIPKPQITWTFQSKASGTFKTILNSGEQIEIVSSQLSDAGHYTCTAKNELGKVQQQTELIVEELIKKKAPVSLISNGSKMNTNYDSTLQLTCKVTGYPAPTIIWKDDKGQVLPSKSSPVLLPYEYISYLSLSHVKKSGRYYCYGTNTLDNTHSSIDVTVLPAFTVDRTSKAPLNVNYDKEAIIHCKIQTSLPHRIYWFRTLNNEHVEQITSSNIYTTLSDRYRSITQHRLKINHMKIDLQGKYTCKATLVADENENATFDTEIKINDLEKPQIEQSEPTLTAREKTHVYIPCNIINGIPKPQITWTFQSKASGTFKTILNSGEQIEIVSSQLSDAGHYTCTAKNELGKVQQQTELIVEAPPTMVIDDKKELYVAAVGDKVLRIPCKAIGYPKPVITWEAFGRPINTDNKYSVEQDGTLAIQKPVEKDTNDTYICEAKNKLGTASEKFYVDVKSYLIHDDHFGNSSKIYLLRGESKQIKCGLPHANADSVRWYQKGLESNITKPFLDFISASTKYDGNYTCRVSNNLGSKSHTYEVDVGNAPRFKLNYDSSEIYWNGNHKQNLNCEDLAETKPSAVVKWTFNGKNIRDASGTQLKIFNWGNYTCELSNPHGVIQRNFTILTKDCSIDRSNKAAPNMPLILTDSPTWQNLETQKQFLILKSGVPLKLSCNNQASKSNSFARFSNKKEVIASCDHNNNILVDGKVYKLSDLGCKSEVMPTVVRTGTKCLYDNTELIKVGFNVDSFVNVYEVCYDTIQHLPLFTRARMSDINNFASVSQNKWYTYSGIGDSKSDKRYTCQNGSESCCYSKSQLISARDANYGPPQTSTFIDYLNAIPVWQPCGNNRITWQSLEDIVRSRYDDDESVFSVWSGTSKPVTVNGAPVPRYLWKVVKSDQSNPLAMVYVNDPAPVPSDILCENVCDDSTSPWDEISDNFTYCCQLEDFVKAFNFTINTFDVL